MYITEIIEDCAYLEELAKKIEERANKMYEKGYELVTASTIYIPEDILNYHAVIIFKKMKEKDIS